MKEKDMYSLKAIFNILITPILATVNTLHADPSPPLIQGQTSTFDVMKVFKGCPIIYTLLLMMSVISAVIWIYSIFTIRLSDMMPRNFMHHIRGLLAEKQFDAALAVCQQENNFSASIIASGIAMRKHGPQVMIDTMQSEGRRSGNSLWQRISLLNEVAVIAPMLGLLGTVLGLFFAFYDSNRTADSISSIFDGLGIAVGTTVVGLVVAILAMIFYSTLKFRVVNVLNSIENESLSLINLIDSETSPTLHLDNK
jgi:biopolymer transport protein ExbB